MNLGRRPRTKQSEMRAAWAAARCLVVALALAGTLALDVATVHGEPDGRTGMSQLFDDVQGGTTASGIMKALSSPFGDDASGASSGGGTAPALSAPAQGRTQLMRSGPAQQAAGPAANLPSRIDATLPLAGSGAANDVQLSQNSDGLITLVVRDASLSRVLSLLAQTQGLNVVAANDLDALVSITLRDVKLEDALTAILSVANYTWVRKNDIILVTSLADGASLPASVQGRQIQVFDLDFAKAMAVSEAVTQFLSPIGKVSFTESDPTDNRRTRESVVVEDMPDVLARIAAYINYVDQPPRQVQIEAHILQVTLDDLNEQGVDLEALFRIANSNLTLKTVGFANADSKNGFIATLEGGDIGAVIDLLQTTTDAKSLGSPRVLVLNEQEARIQVGRQEGYKTSTTTETSTIEQVQFLETGVILTIRPRISRDGRVLLYVKPEVSDGSVNQETGLPEEETTQVETSVMLRSGQGMVIGGLIKEEDSVAQKKVPYLGDVKYLGWFFRHTEVKKERVEVIVALVPRVQPYNPDWQAYEEGNLVKAGVPLMDGPLCRTYRPFDPVLPDGKRVYRPLIPPKPLWEPEVPCYPRDVEYYVPRRPLPQQNLFGADCEPVIEMSPNQPAPFLSDEAHWAPQIINPDGSEELPPPSQKLDAKSIQSLNGSTPQQSKPFGAKSSVETR